MPRRSRSESPSAFSAVRAAIDGIGHTEDDPQPIGRDIPYSTFVLSLSAARQSIDHVTSGIAVRYRTGQVDGVRGSTFGLDGGVLVERVLGRNVRLGVSSFLWGPGTGDGKDATFSGALDTRVIGADSTQQARLGYSYTAGDGASAGHYFFASGRFARWIGRAGIARTVGVRHQRYVAPPRPRRALRAIYRRPVARGKRGRIRSDIPVRAQRNFSVKTNLLDLDPSAATQAVRDFAVARGEPAYRGTPGGASPLAEPSRRSRR